MRVLQGIAVIFALCFAVKEVQGGIPETCKNAKLWKGKTDLDWFRMCIVTHYGFVKDPVKDEWKSVPSLRGQGIGDAHFNLAAQKAEDFFKKNNDWGTMKTAFSCRDLLVITAARYIYVTHVLYHQSDRQLQPCNKDGKKTVVPQTGSCFPPPYGSARCTSDYDVGLVGPASGTLTGKFNDFFQRQFGKPSEQIFDTNVYAFTLEFALPSSFSGLSKEFVKQVSDMNAMPQYKMQELATALFKVYKYSDKYYNELTNAVLSQMRNGAGKLPQWLKMFKSWKHTLESWNTMKELKDKDKYDFRKDHNDMYQEIVGDVSGSGQLLPGYMAQVGFALLYAAEAYHTRGAMRHVVGITQMNDPVVKREIKPIDYWASMLENWGDANKEHGHCKVKTPAKCLVKMCKYLWRVYDAMDAIDKNPVTPQSNSDPNVAELSAITKNWLNNYKTKPQLDTKVLQPFQTQVHNYCFYKKTKPRCKGCDNMADCLDSIETMVMDYHHKMIQVVNTNKI